MTGIDLAGKIMLITGGLGAIADHIEDRGRRRHSDSRRYQVLRAGIENTF